MASVDNKIVEIFIPGPAGRLEAKYFKIKVEKFYLFFDVKYSLLKKKKT